LFFFRGPGPIVGQRRRVMAPTFAPAASYLNARRVNLQVIPGSFGNLLEMLHTVLSVTDRRQRERRPCGNPSFAI